MKNKKEIWVRTIKYLVIIMFCNIIISKSHAQYFSIPKNLDQLQSAYENASTTEEEFRALINLSSYYEKRQNNMDSALIYGQIITDLGINQKNDLIHAAGLKHLGRIHTKKRNFTIAKDYLTKSIKIAENSTLPINKVSIFNCMADN